MIIMKALLLISIVQMVCQWLGLIVLHIFNLHFNFKSFIIILLIPFGLYYVAYKGIREDI